MRVLRSHLTLTTAVLALSAGSALADVTPQDVWAAMRGQVEGMGYQVTVETLSDTPQSLVLGKVSYLVPIPDGGNVTMDVGGMRFDSDGSGGVTGDFSNLTMTLVITNVPGETFEADVAVEGAGLDVHFSGTPEALDSTFDWPVATYRLTGVRLEGKDLNAQGSVTASNSKGTYRFLAGSDGVTIESNMTIGRLGFEGTFQDPEEEPSDFAFSGSVGGFAASTSGMQGNMFLGNIADHDGASNISYGPGEMTMVVSGQEGDLTVRGSVTSGYLNTAVTGGALSYNSGSTGFEMAAEGSIMPIPPVSMKLASTETGLQLPLVAAEEPQDFGLKLVLDGLEISDTIWSMFDPTALLSHDPATLSIDVTGQAVLSMDIAMLAEDPEAMADAMASEPPGEMRSVQLNGLLVRALGAEVNASGQGEFPPGLPFPLGSVDISASGLMTVIQNLTQLGLLDAQSAGMAQMGLGMFAEPGDAPDTWTSKIEMSMDKGLLVNGKPMQ